jgi:plasmid stabilization system protein ParE
MNLLNTLLGGHDKTNSPELMTAIAKAVDWVEPLLRQTDGYPNQYRKSVARAVSYANELAAKVPGPLAITPESYTTNPLVHALFPVQDDLQLAMQRSRDMQDFLKSNPDAEGIYVLMCMRRISKSMRGIELDGDVLRRDVPQEAIYFTDITIAEPGLTETDTRQCIAKCIFESLIDRVAQRIKDRKQQKIALIQTRDELLARLHMAPPEQRPEFERRLADVLKQLADTISSLEMGQYIKDFEAIFLKPEEYLFLEYAKINLDSMGIVRDPTTPCSNEVEFCDLIGRDLRRWTLTMVTAVRLSDGSNRGTPRVMGVSER